MASSRPLRYRYKAIVTRVIDGDSLELEVDMGLYIKCEITARLSGINCPEMNTQAGKQCKLYVKEMIEGKEVEIQTFKQGSFKRWLVTVYVGPLVLNPHLVEKGMAVEYRKTPRRKLPENQENPLGAVSEDGNG